MDEGAGEHATQPTPRWRDCKREGGRSSSQLISWRPIRSKPYIRLTQAALVNMNPIQSKGLFWLERELGISQ